MRVISVLAIRGFEYDVNALTFPEKGFVDMYQTQKRKQFLSNSA